MSQLNQFKDASGNWLTGQSLYILVGLVLLTMLIIWGLQTQLSCFINCNFGCFGIVVGFGIDTRRLVILLLFKVVFHLYQYTIQSGNLSFNFPYAVIMAGVGLIESLLTLNIIDEITETR
jgi:SulP family sulfate permease